MAKLYSAMDVHLLVSCGEGFGIPILEAQSCGTPVIVGDWTSMPELCFSGWKVDKKDSTPIWGALQSYTFLPKVGAIVDKLELAYQMHGNVSYRKAVRKGAMAYDADKVVEKYWLPTLKKIESKILDESITTYMLNGGKL
jgi:glycosyltransferase involved in cell wall biosynthesis